MDHSKKRAPTQRRDMIGLAVFLLACFSVSAIGGAVTATSVGTWYQDLVKPPFNPPDWVFAPVWTALYAMMAVAGWRVWRRVGVLGSGRAFSAYALQLFLNLAWSFLFFGFQRVGVALAEILMLLVAVLATMVLFWRLDRWAGALFVPYAVWVGYAAVLNAAILVLN